MFCKRFCLIMVYVYLIDERENRFVALSLVNVIAQVMEVAGAPFHETADNFVSFLSLTALSLLTYSDGVHHVRATADHRAGNVGLIDAAAAVLLLLLAVVQS